MIGKRIRQLREKVGLTQQELATRAGVSRIYIAELETGVKRNPTIGILAKLAKVLKVDVAELIG